MEYFFQIIFSNFLKYGLHKIILQLALSSLSILVDVITYKII